MLSQRTFTTGLGSVLGLVLVSQVLLPGQATADDRSGSPQVAISQAAAYDVSPLTTDDDPWH